MVESIWLAALYSVAVDFETLYKRSHNKALHYNTWYVKRMVEVGGGRGFATAEQIHQGGSVVTSSRIGSSAGLQQRKH